MSPRGPTLAPYADGSGILSRMVDSAVVVACAWLAVTSYARARWNDQTTLAALLAVLFFQVMGESVGLYRAWRGVPIRQEVFMVVATWLMVVPTLLALAFFTKRSTDYSRVATITWFITTPVAVACYRIVLRLTLRILRARGVNQRTAAIIGLTDIGKKLADRILNAPWLGMNLLGFFDDRGDDRLPLEGSPAPLVGTFEDAVEGARRGEIDSVYVALPLKAETRVAQLLRALGDTTASVYVVPDFFVFDLLHGRWSALGEVPIVSIFETPFYGVDGFVKRLEDIVLGTFAVIVAAPIMLVICIAIKLTSKGPIFFKQRRYGLNGEVIEILKFRSMTVAEDGTSITQAKQGDSRVTRVGKFIRRASLDELPQLFHVVTGKMSLVGPRPHAVAHNEEYRKRIQGYMLRHKVKPGLTGWAQVNGWRGETDTLEKMEKRIEHDLEYIRRWGLLFDIQICFLTVFGRKVRRNAY